MEKPLLVSGPLIYPILEGRKTETRRLSGLEGINKNPDRYEFKGMVFSAVGEYRSHFKDLSTGWGHFVKSPYGLPETTLWVRENWYAEKSYNKVSPKFIPAEGAKVGYAADGNKPEWAGKTRPSIHLPRRLSRINLLTEHIYCERLQDISDDSAIAEGILSFKYLPGDGPAQPLYFDYLTEKWGRSPIHSFQTLWQSINGKESWDTNPWVWVVKFSLIK